MPGAIDDLATLAQQFSIPLGSATIIPERLAQAAQRLGGLADLLRGVGGPSEVRFSLEEDMPFRTGDRITVVSPATYRFPTALLVMVVAISGVLQQEVDVLTVEGKRARLLVGRAFRAPTLSDVQGLFGAACQLVEDEGVENLLPVFPKKEMEQVIAFLERAVSER